MKAQRITHSARHDFNQQSGPSIDDILSAARRLAYVKEKSRCNPWPEIEDLDVEAPQKIYWVVLDRFVHEVTGLSIRQMLAKPDKRSYIASRTLESKTLLSRRISKGDIHRVYEEFPDNLKDFLEKRKSRATLVEKMPRPEVILAAAKDFYKAYGFCPTEIDGNIMAPRGLPWAMLIPYFEECKKTRLDSYFQAPVKEKAVNNGSNASANAVNTLFKKNRRYPDCKTILDLIIAHEEKHQKHPDPREKAPPPYGNFKWSEFYAQIHKLHKYKTIDQLIQEVRLRTYKEPKKKSPAAKTKQSTASDKNNGTGPSLTAA